MYKRTIKLEIGVQLARCEKAHNKMDVRKKFHNTGKMKKLRESEWSIYSYMHEILYK